MHCFVTRVCQPDDNNTLISKTDCHQSYARHFSSADFLHAGIEQRLASLAIQLRRWRTSMNSGKGCKPAKDNIEPWRVGFARWIGGRR